MFPLKTSSSSLSSAYFRSPMHPSNRVTMAYSISNITDDESWIVNALSSETKDQSGSQQSEHRSPELRQQDIKESQLEQYSRSHLGYQSEKLIRLQSEKLLENQPVEQSEQVLEHRPVGQFEPQREHQVGGQLKDITEAMPQNYQLQPLECNIPPSKVPADVDDHRNIGSLLSVASTLTDDEDAHERLINTNHLKIGTSNARVAKKSSRREDARETKEVEEADRKEEPGGYRFLFGDNGNSPEERIVTPVTSNSSHSSVKSNEDFDLNGVPVNGKWYNEMFEGAIAEDTTAKEVMLRRPKKVASESSNAKDPKFRDEGSRTGLSKSLKEEVNHMYETKTEGGYIYVENLAKECSSHFQSFIKGAENLERRIVDELFPHGKDMTGCMGESCSNFSSGKASHEFDVSRSVNSLIKDSQVKNEFKSKMLEPPLEDIANSHMFPGMEKSEVELILSGEENAEGKSSIVLGQKENGNVAIDTAFSDNDGNEADEIFRHLSGGFKRVGSRMDFEKLRSTYRVKRSPHYTREISSGGSTDIVSQIASTIIRVSSSISASGVSGRSRTPSLSGSVGPSPVKKRERYFYSPETKVERLDSNITENELSSSGNPLNGKNQIRKEKKTNEKRTRERVGGKYTSAGKNKSLAIQQRKVSLARLASNSKGGNWKKKIYS